MNMGLIMLASTVPNAGGLQDIAKFVQDYGVTTVISIVFLYAAVQLINIGIGWVKNKAGNTATDNKKISESFDRKSEVDFQIKMLIEKALLETNGNRIYIMEYHNHSDNLSKVPIYYMSCNYEVYKTGLLPIGNQFKQVSTSLFPKFLSNLQSNEYVILDTENVLDTLDGYELLKAKNEKAALVIPMRNFAKIPIGYVALTRNDEFTEKDKIVMLNVAAQIGVLLSTFDKKEAKQK